MLKNSEKIILLFFLLIFMLPASAIGKNKVGFGSLSSLIQSHLPHKQPYRSGSIDRFETKIKIEGSNFPVVIELPGFKFYGCGECHETATLVQKAAKTLSVAISYIREEIPAVKKIPLRRFIIQPWSDALLKENQFAHATFDAVRVFPRTMIIDANVYRNATLIHEILHLTQPFVGHPNELEAYSLNVLADPKFLLFNYRYFENAIQMFYIPDFQVILKEFFAREIKGKWDIPAETQWFMLPANEAALERIATGIFKLRPAIEEAFRINRANPLLVSYWSERTGIPSLPLDLAMVKLLSLPPITATNKIHKKAFQIFSRQFDKLDNTALGYIIDRKKETLMTLRYKHSLKDAEQGLALYYNFLKKRFFGKDNRLNLEPDNPEDFKNYLGKKSREIRTLAEYPGMSEEERSAGISLANRIELSAKNFISRQPK